MSLMLLLKVLISSSYCVVSRFVFSIRVGIPSSMTLCLLLSTLGGLLIINVFPFTAASSLMLLIAIHWPLPISTITYVTMSGLFVRM